MQKRLVHLICLTLALALPGLARAADFAAPRPAEQVNRERALQCMTLAIAYEAGFEPVTGRQAVAEVILNRMRSPSYPKSVCGVVFQGSSRSTGCQFTFTCDGALGRPLTPAVLAAARDVAARVLAGDFVPSVAGATHYHANYVSPYWAPRLVRTTRIGAHIFYRGQRGPSEAARYAGSEEPVMDQVVQRFAAGNAQLDGATPPAMPAAASSVQFTLWGLAPARP